MKKAAAVFALALVCTFAWIIWGQGESYTIHVTVPAGTMNEFIFIEDFIYSDEEISPQKKQLTLKSIDVPDRTEFVLKPIEVTEENAYERTYFTKREHGLKLVSLCKILRTKILWWASLLKM